MTVLIRGESGTGKELVARAIHHASERRERPMLAVNCAALRENLLESELFGHEKGAFTGADRLRRGRFELADGGTLLLDEISEIAPALQAKLLRVLQESAVRARRQQPDAAGRRARRRDDQPQSRAIGARREVPPGSVLPPQRRADRVAAAAPARRKTCRSSCRHFLHQIAKREGSAFRHIEPEAVRLLQKYAWPGNVRELQNIIERACVLESAQGVVRAETLEPWLKIHGRDSGDDLAGRRWRTSRSR